MKDSILENMHAEAGGSRGPGRRREDDTRRPGRVRLAAGCPRAGDHAGAAPSRRQRSAFGYAWLDGSNSIPSDGITLHFAGQDVQDHRPELKRRVAAERAAAVRDRPAPRAVDSGSGRPDRNNCGKKCRNHRRHCDQVIRPGNAFLRDEAEYGSI